jgi:hypothetical protein
VRIFCFKKAQARLQAFLKQKRRAPRSGVADFVVEAPP